MATTFGSASLGSQANLLQSKENIAMQAVQNSAGNRDDAKILKSSTEFESILMSNWLQQAEKSFGTVPGAGDDDDAAQRDQVMSFGAQILGSSLAASGGIGIGKMVAKALHAKDVGPQMDTEPKVINSGIKSVHEKMTGIR